MLHHFRVSDVCSIFFTYPINILVFSPPKNRIKLPAKALEKLSQANVHVEHYWDSDEPIPREAFLNWFVWRE
jgi:hypothetical protein